MNAREAAERWARTWESGWNRGDVEAIVELYAPDVVFSSEPFRTPYRGVAGVREYVTQAFGAETEVTAHFGQPIAAEERAAVPWCATLLEAGAPTTLAGTSVLRFDAEGRVVDQWDSWNELDERREPPAGWR